MAERLSPDRVRELVREAGEIAKSLPPELQEAGFHRSLDLLVGPSDAEQGEGRRGEQPRGGRQARRAEGEGSPGGGKADPADQIVESLDRTAHPEVTRANGVRDPALWVLKLANDECGIDGLTAPQTARVLREKFRLSVRNNAVHMALARATDYVDSRKVEGATVFRIMVPGERHLESMQKSGDEPDEETTRSRPRGRRSASKASQRPRTVDAKEPKRSRRSGTPGPKALVSELIAEGFFNEPKPMAAILDELRDKKGRVLKPTDLSPALVRLLREGRVRRERNDRGQYEYVAQT